MQLISVAAKGNSKAGVCISDCMGTQQRFIKSTHCLQLLVSRWEKQNGDDGQFYWDEKISHQLRCLKWEKLVLVIFEGAYSQSLGKACLITLYVAKYNKQRLRQTSNLPLCQDKVFERKPIEPKYRSSSQASLLFLGSCNQVCICWAGAWACCFEIQ